MKLFVAGALQETNDFSPIPTGWESFADQQWDPRVSPEPPEHVNLLGYGGAVERAQELGLDIAPGLYVSAVPAAPPSAACWNHIRQRILEDLQQALPVDAVFLFLHGAMSAEGAHDCEGDLLRDVRKIVGDDVPVAALFDLHGNMSANILSATDFVMACHEYPHIDFAERGRQAVDLLVAQANGQSRPTSVAVRIPMMTVSPTTSGPMQDFVADLRDVEARESVLSVSAFHGFFGADHHEVGASIVVVTESDPELAGSLAGELSERFVAAVLNQGQIGVTLDQALDDAEATDDTVVIADRADNTGGGAGGDSTVMLAEMLRRGLRDATLGYIWDPVVADFCHLAGVGSRVKLRLGGKVGPMSGEPLDVEAEVLANESDIRQAWFGQGKPNLPMGKSAAIRVDGIDVVVGSVRHQVFSRHVFEGHGIDLATKKIIVVKSTQHFAGAYASLGRIIYCDVPGTVSMDFSTLPYRNLARPIWPLDTDRPAATQLWPIRSD